MSSIANAAALGGARRQTLPDAPDDPGSRLKICFIAETVHAGVGRHIVDAIRGLAERGHEVHLLYSPTRLDPEFLIAIERQPNVHCRAIPMPRAIGAGDFRALAEIRRYMAANRPFDVIHGHSSKGGGYARLLRLFGFAPVIYTPHAFITMSPMLRGSRRLMYHAIEAILACLSDRVICGSAFEGEHARFLGIPDRRRTVIANGSEAVSAPSRDRVREELGIRAEEIVVGFVGRMDDQKAPERLVAAARQLLPQLPQLRFLLIGDGPKRQLLETSLQQAALDDRVLWLGAVQARQYMPAFDILALTSLYEGFAYVLIEALYAGLPIVSTPVGGTLETIVPGVNGILVPDGSPAAIAAAIRALVIDAALRQAMAEASRARAERFSSGRMVDAMEDLYFAVQQERRKRSLRRQITAMGTGD